MLKFLPLLIAFSLLAACTPRGTPAAPPADVPQLDVSSPAFSPGKPIPKEYTCDGADRSPALRWEGVPAGAQSLAILMQDPDAPGGTFTHWILVNLPASLNEIPGGLPAEENVLDGALQGKNDFGRLGYGGPCPPAGKAHHYIFTVYALDQMLSLDKAPSRDPFLQAIQGHVLAAGQLTGTYQR